MITDSIFNEANMFLQAAQDGDLKKVNTLLSDGKVDLDVANQKGSTALMNASLRGYLDIVDCLIKKNANVNKTNTFGNAALHFACQSGHVRIIEALLDADADINMQNEAPYKYTPLISACTKGESDAVEVLLRRGANPDLVTQVGNSALILAAREGSKATVRLLIDKGADVNICNMYGETALILAAQDRRLGIVQMLLEAHANVHIKDKDQFDALMKAAAVGHKDIVRVLLERGAMTGDTHAFDALVVAREYCRTEIAEMLLEHARAQEESVLDKSLHAMQHAVGQGVSHMVRAWSRGSSPGMSMIEDRMSSQSDPPPMHDGTPHHKHGHGFMHAAASMLRRVIPIPRKIVHSSVSGNSLPGKETGTDKTFSSVGSNSTEKYSGSDDPNDATCLLNFGAPSTKEEIYPDLQLRCTNLTHQFEVASGGLSVVPELVTIGLPLEDVPAPVLRAPVNGEQGPASPSAAPPTVVPASACPYACLAALHTQLTATAVDYHARTQWLHERTETLDAKNKLTDSKAENKDYVEIGRRIKVLKTVEARETELKMQAREYKQFPQDCRDLLVRLSDAMDHWDVADEDHIEALAALAASLQVLIRQLDSPKPIATVAGTSEHPAPPQAPPAVSEVVATITTSVPTPFLFKTYPILGIRDAFDRAADNAVHINPTIRKILRGHFVQYDEIMKRHTKYDFLIKCATLERQEVPSASKVSAIQREHSVYASLQGELKFDSAVTGCVWCWDVHPENHYLVLEDFGEDFRRVLDSVNRSHHQVMEESIIALKALHSRNIVHGDIKPQNLLIKFDHGTCKVKLCDLDCAQVTGTECRAADLGTKGYIPPETFFAAQRDESVHVAPAMDLFALGLVFWQVLNASQTSALAGLTTTELENAYTYPAELQRHLPIPEKMKYYNTLMSKLLALTKRVITADKAHDEIVTLSGSNALRIALEKSEELARRLARESLLVPEPRPLHSDSDPVVCAPALQDELTHAYDARSW